MAISAELNICRKLTNKAGEGRKQKLLGGPRKKPSFACALSIVQGSSEGLGPPDSKIINSLLTSNHYGVSKTVIAAMRKK